VDTLESAVQQHYYDLKRIAASFVNDPTVADDLCQEVFTRLCQKINSGYEITDMWSYMKGVFRRVWLEHLRSKKRLKIVDDDQIAPRTELTPDHHVEQTELLIRLREFLPMLSQDDQNIIMGRYFLDMTGDELSDWLNVPRRTLVDRYMRAMDRLKWMAFQRDMIK
jgi:RNA polymerase sigma factor (sigma-70 family)